ncbi:MAG: glycosyltransferase [Deltaproteobacteria bacterium]|nr:MAG: glycosyltransferase [Deltaproteobacteria bacterium]
MTTRPKVALFSTNFLEYSQTFVYDELRHHERYDVDVYCMRRLNADRFPWPSVHVMEGASGPAARLDAALCRVTTLSARRYRALVRGDYALFHAHFGPGSVYALPYARALRKPLVVTVHGYDVPLLLSDRRYHPRFWRYAAAAPLLRRTVTRWLAASTELAEMLVDLGMPSDRVFVHRLGVEIPQEDPLPPRTPRYLLMVGRFVEKKGFVYGLRAFARIAHRYPDVELHLIGGGDLEGTLRDAAAALGIASRVRFLGVLPHAEVLATMARAYALVAPSVVAGNADRESGLIVVKEAAARGVPAVGTWHGGIPEIIDDGETGFLVPTRNSPALAEKMAALLDDPHARDRMGRAARDKMRRCYDLRARVRDLERHYDDVVAGT